MGMPGLDQGRCNESRHVFLKICPNLNSALTLSDSCTGDLSHVTHFQAGNFRYKLLNCTSVPYRPAHVKSKLSIKQHIFTAHVDHKEIMLKNRGPQDTAEVTSKKAATATDVDL